MHALLQAWLNPFAKHFYMLTNFQTFMNIKLSHTKTYLKTIRLI